MKIKVRGFLLWESMIALLISVLGVSAFFLCFSQNKLVERQMENRVDRELAYHIMRRNDLNKVVIHDHLYLAEDNHEKR